MAVRAALAMSILGFVRYLVLRMNDDGCAEVDTVHSSYLLPPIIPCFLFPVLASGFAIPMCLERLCSFLLVQSVGLDLMLL